jgi:uncharacterized Zn-finger protein
LHRGNAYHCRRQTVNPLKERRGGVMGPFETITIDTAVAACDGGGALGHPTVYLNLAPSGKVECPYCSRRFVNPAMMADGPQQTTAGISSRASPASAQRA